MDHLRNFRYIVVLESVRTQKCLCASQVLWFFIFSFFQILKHKISLLEASNAELHHELKRHRITSENLAQRAVDAQVFF